MSNSHGLGDQVSLSEVAPGERIFDLNRIEGELEESQQRLSTILNTVQVGIIIIDAQTHTIVDINPEAAAIIGSPREQIVGVRCHKFICAAEDGQCPITDLGQGIDNAERVLIRANGEKVTVVKTVARVKLRGRDHLVESFFDISGRIRTEQALKQSEERYRDLLENANDLIQSVDASGSFLYVNRAWKETLGYSDQEVAALKVFDVISPDCLDHCTTLFGRIMLGESVPRVEVPFISKDGRTVILEGSINCSSTEGQAPVTRAIFRDITERKRAEEERREWNLRLERMVEEKTRHLREAQAKLIQSEKMSTLGEVISGASHELNNPLAGILSAIQMLRKSSLSRPIGPELLEGIDVLEDMESAAIRCQRIVDDLIRFSTQSRCNFSPMDLNQVLKDTLEILGEQHAEAGIEVNCCMDPALPAIEGDFVKLLEVFVNLLQNAESALSDGGTIDISTRLVKKHAEPPQVLISIRDTGCGISAENLGKIFDPFYTTKPVGKGPGLGLTVSYGIIKRHGGDIDVRSSTGKGTDVTVTLPLKQVKE